MQVVLKDSVLAIPAAIKKKKKTPQSRWFISNRNFSLIVLETGKSMNRVPADLVSGKVNLPVSQPSFYYALM